MTHFLSEVIIMRGKGPFLGRCECREYKNPVESLMDKIVTYFLNISGHICITF